MNEAHKKRQFSRWLTVNQDNISTGKVVISSADVHWDNRHLCLYDIEDELRRAGHKCQMVYEYKESKVVRGSMNIIGATCYLGSHYDIRTTRNLQIALVLKNTEGYTLAGCGKNFSLPYSDCTVYVLVKSR